MYKLNYLWYNIDINIKQVYKKIILKIGVLLMTNLQNLQTAVKVIEKGVADPIESYYTKITTKLSFLGKFEPIEYYIDFGTDSGTVTRDEEIVSETFWVELTHKLDELIATVEEEGIHFEDYFTEEQTHQFNMYDDNDSKFN